MASYLKSLRLVMDVTGNKNFKESYSNFLIVSQLLIVGSTNLSQNYSLYSYNYCIVDWMDLERVIITRQEAKNLRKISCYYKL